MTTGYTTGIYAERQHLSGITDTVIGFGLTIPNATTHEDVVNTIYSRLNFNANVGSIWKTEKFSKELVSNVLWSYKVLVLDNKIGFYDPKGQNTSSYNLIANYIGNNKKVVPTHTTIATILNDLYWAVNGTPPAVNPIVLYPQRTGTSEEARRAMDIQEQYAQAAKANVEAQAAKDKTGVINSVTGLLTTGADSASRLATIMSYAVPGVVIVGGLTVITLVFLKVKQFDTNNAYNQTQKTTRKLGPDIAKAVMFADVVP